MGLTRAEILQKAREAKAEKKRLVDVAKLRGETVTEVEDFNTEQLEDYDDGVWFEGLIVAMRNREVKSANDVAACVPIADAVLAAYKEHVK